MIFRGLAKEASVTLRVIQAMELLPSNTASIRPFVRPAPRNDPRAIEAYYATRVELAHTYPSEWNSLGILMTALSTAAARLWPSVRAAVPHVMAGLAAARAEYAARLGQPSADMGSKSVVVVGRNRAPSRPKRVKKVKVTVAAKRKSIVRPARKRAQRSK
jgi:hypothetical protein